MTLMKLLDVALVRYGGKLKRIEKPGQSCFNRLAICVVFTPSRLEEIRPCLQAVVIPPPRTAV